MIRIFASFLFLILSGTLFAESREMAPARETTSPRLRALGALPDWTSLKRFDNCLTRAEFTLLMDSIYAPDSPWQELLKCDEKGVFIKTDSESDSSADLYIEFASDAKFRQAVPRYWKSRDELPLVPSAAKPLAGLHVALDPGHIGGSWGKMEGRFFQMGHDIPVMEGDLTLKTAKLLKLMLESLGARVSLVRPDSEPVTGERPETLAEEAEVLIEQDYYLPGIAAIKNPALKVSRSAELLFYRISEIRARAELVNHVIKPDIVLALHFNAEPWPDPARPSLVDRNHFHILINGSYSSDELAHDDERYKMLTKLFSSSAVVELDLARAIGRSFKRITGMPPFIYSGNNAHRVGSSEYVWSRNLLANRLYRCPVVYLEPYVANSKAVYSRIQAGDYTGRKEVDGKPQMSIFREYARAVVAGMVEYYGTKE